MKNRLIVCIGLLNFFSMPGIWAADGERGLPLLDTGRPSSARPKRRFSERALVGVADSDDDRGSFTCGASAAESAGDLLGGPASAEGELGSAGEVSEGEGFLSPAASATASREFVRDNAPRLAEMGGRSARQLAKIVVAQQTNQLEGVAREVHVLADAVNGLKPEIGRAVEGLSEASVKLENIERRAARRRKKEGNDNK
jgi:hypothetical protein